MVNYIALAVALALSAVSAYYSIVGLTTIFASAFIPIVIMGSTLEAAKLVAVSWIYRNWSNSPRLIKYYLLTAIAVLMLITSMGTFGFLSKAHMDQAVPTGSVQDKINLYDEKIKIAKENIDANRKALKQMDEAVDQIMARSSDEAGATKASALRKQQSRERNALFSSIEAEQKTIADLNDQRAPLASELRKIVAEVGPIKYIAELVYEKATDDILDKAVRWVIILIVVVFDPLAIVLLIAANHGLYGGPKGVTFVEPTPTFDPEVQKKDKDPLWIRKVSQRLKEKKKRGTIEIDETDVVRM